jgi:predicted short-subunit dehydrogenase-like oxidoreductase (DUF2520 family)
MERVAFVGPGRVGLGLGAALVEANPDLQLCYYGRHRDPPGHPLFDRPRTEYRYGLERPDEGTVAVFLTVPDAVLADLVPGLASRGPAPARCAAFHCSGPLGSELLSPLFSQGYSVGTFHPLRSIPHGPLPPHYFEGVHFALSGEPLARSIAGEVVSVLGGRILEVPASRRPLYHAAAVLASNYLVVLLREAVQLMERAGATHPESEEALVSLAFGTLENVRAMGLDRALTGPLVRGDVEVMEVHLRSMEPDERSVYIALGRRALDGVSGDLSPDAAGRIDELFERYS